MSQPASAVDFVRALAQAVLGQGDPAALAETASAALAEVLSQRKSLVVEVQFTGFIVKGKPIGGVDPLLLRAAAQLIMHRITRIGFTSEITREGLAAVFATVARPPAELAGRRGVVGVLAETEPDGVYVSTSGGDVYRPRAAEPAAPPSAAADPVPAAEPPATPPSAVNSAPTAEPLPVAAPADPAPTAPSAPAADAPAAEAAPPERPTYEEDEDAVELASFELIDALPDLTEDPRAAAKGRVEEEAPTAREEPGQDDLYHFFRASTRGVDAEAEALPAMLHEASNLGRFEEVAQSCSRTAARLVEVGQFPEAVALLDALVREAESPDRSRVFRDSAVQALRRVGTDRTLHNLVDVLPHGGATRESLLRFFIFLGGEALTILEGVLFRTTDGEMRRTIFRRLIAVDGMGDKILERAMSDPVPSRTRAMLELATLPDLDPELARRWVAQAAAHPDATVRIDAARMAAALTGRGGLRILLDLLSDPERLVKRPAIQGIGTLGDPTAIPFLARLLTDSSDEDVQLAVITALGKIGSPEALPALLGVLNKRQLFSTKRANRAKLAALGSLTKLPSASATDVLRSFSTGKDAELAEEARRLLSTQLGG